MKPVTKVCLTIAILLPLAVSASVAQNTAGDKPVPRDEKSAVQIMVIDIEYLLRNHGGLERKLSDLLTETEEFADQVSEEQVAMKEKCRTLLDFKPDSLEHQRMSEELARAEGGLQAFAGAKRQMFRRRESALYYDAYNEIVVRAKAFAKRHGTAVVLNYNSGLVDRDDPDDVERAIRGHVVYQDQRNITRPILDEINRDLGGELRGNSIYKRPIDELRATGLKFPFYQPPKPSCRAPAVFRGRVPWNAISE